MSGNGNPVSRAELAAHILRVEEKIDGIAQRILNIENKLSWPWRIIDRTLPIIFGGLIVYLSTQ